MNGVDLLTVSTLLSHKNVSMTERYLHLVNKSQHLEQAVEKAIGRDPGQLPELPSSLDEVEPVRPTEKPKRAGRPVYLTEAQKRDYEAHAWAVANVPELARASDRKVFAWLKSQERFAGKLPSNCDVFRRNLARARLACGTQRVKRGCRHPVSAVEKGGVA
jgi:hypothetical protein